MALTIGAVILLIGLMFLIYYGYTVGVRRSVKPGREHLQKCSLCLQTFECSKLIERQASISSGRVGDSKLFYFCEECVKNLSEEFERATGIAERKNNGD